MNCTRHLWRTKVAVVLLSAAIGVGIPSTSFAEDVPLESRAASLRVGDSEADVLRIMQGNPKEVQRTNVLGVEHVLLVFESGRVRQQFTLIGGRLVAKSTTTRPARWGLF